MPDNLEIGGRIYNFQGREALIYRIEQGKYGIAIKANFVNSGNELRGYIVPEVPALESGEQRFYEFTRTFIRMPSGNKYSLFCFGRGSQRPRTPEEYDRAWEKSAEEAKKHIMGIQIATNIPGGY